MNKKWDRRFLEMARLVSSWSKDPSTKVGCVLVKERKIISTGYNGFPKQIADDDRLNNRQEKYPRVIHAEMNAILQAGRDVMGAVMYMYFPGGGPPCSECTKHVVAAGIGRIVVHIGDKNERWYDNQMLGSDMLKEAGIAVDEIELV